MIKKKGNSFGGFEPDDWDGDGKIDDYDEMTELRMFEKISKTVSPPGFDIFEDSHSQALYDDDLFDDDDEDDDFDRDDDDFDRDDGDFGFGVDDWDSDDF